MDENKIIGIRLKEKREELGLIQSQVAKMTGIKKNTISNYENSISEPSIENIIKLMIALQCDANYLFGFKNNEANVLVKSDYPDEQKQRLDNNYDALNQSAQKALVDYSDFMTTKPENLKEAPEDNKNVS